jgi:hypothetical protein
MDMNVSDCAISREEALQISPDYVALCEGDFSAYGKIIDKFNALKRGQKVITYHDGQFINAQVSSVQSNPDGDGPKIRVATKKFTWRVDGSKYAFPR